MTGLVLQRGFAKTVQYGSSPLTGARKNLTVGIWVRCTHIPTKNDILPRRRRGVLTQVSL